MIVNMPNAPHVSCYRINEQCPQYIWEPWILKARKIIKEIRGENPDALKLRFNSFAVNQDGYTMAKLDAESSQKIENILSKIFQGNYSGVYGSLPPGEKITDVFSEGYHVTLKLGENEDPKILQQAIFDAVTREKPKTSPKKPKKAGRRAGNTSRPSREEATKKELSDITNTLYKKHGYDLANSFESTVDFLQSSPKIKDAALMGRWLVLTIN